MHAKSSNDHCSVCGRDYYCRPMVCDVERSDHVKEQEQDRCHVCPECAAVRWQDTESDCAPSANRYLQQHGPLSQTLHAALAAPCLFYPGAGYDISPALLFASSGAVSTVVYADYITGNRCAEVFDDFEHPKGPPFGAAWKMLETGALRADDFGFDSPDAYYPSVSTFGDDLRERQVDPMKIGSWARFRGRDGQVLSFFYFFTEAIQTYLNLWGINGRAPLAVVVQNHGLGALWTALDGDCLLYAAAQRLPKYLYVGDIGSEPWPGYRRVSREGINWNSQYHSKRALFRAEAPSPLNPHSPLNVWDGRSASIQTDRYPEFRVLKITRPTVWRW